MQYMPMFHSQTGKLYTQMKPSSQLVHDLLSFLKRVHLSHVLNNLLIILTSFLIEHNLFCFNSSEVIQSILPDVLRLLALTPKRKSVEDCLSATL